MNWEESRKEKKKRRSEIIYRYTNTFRYILFINFPFKMFLYYVFAPKLHSFNIFWICVFCFIPSFHFPLIYSFSLSFHIIYYICIPNIFLVHSVEKVKPREKLNRIIQVSKYDQSNQKANLPLPIRS